MRPSWKDEKMRENLQKGSRIGAAVLLLTGLLLGGGIWCNDRYNRPFQDATMELGGPLPEVGAFVKAGKDPANAQFVTDIETLDLTKPGQYPVYLRSRTAKQLVTLTVADTTAPEVVFQDVLADLDTELKPEMFIAQLTDLSATTAEFAQAPEKGETYSEAEVTVLVTDAYGNRTEGSCTVTYMWMHPEVTLELGQTLTKEMLLLNPERDGALIEQSRLDEISKAPTGTYTVTAVNGQFSRECVVTVADTTAPELKLKSVKMDSNQTLKIEQFVSKATDLSGKVTLSYKEKPDPTKEGTYTVTIIATDANGNSTKGETTLKVSYDTTPPKFSGVSAMTIKRGVTPNYEKGVKAKDSRDGNVKFTYDASRVNPNKSGTYYVIYTATDSSGNTATHRRKVTVGHGPEDTAELVRSIAAKLSNDPVAIAKWVRSNISYGNTKASDWGGDDPVWSGLKNKRGNCYVHAKVLEALLKEKGFRTQIIHVNQTKYFSNIKASKPSHYWNLVYVNGVWRHIDSTPGTKHPAYLMTDQQRYANLQGRDWDRDKWPKCE